MNEIATPITQDNATFGGLDRFLRQQLLGQMRGLRHGRLVLQDACGTVELGEPASAHSDLQIHLQVLDPDFYRAVARNGSVGAGESYMDGQWHCDNLVGLIQLLVRNRDLLDGM
jgi:cyclopropane-fatty-acyl-phospholipid synthase